MYDFKHNSDMCIISFPYYLSAADMNIANKTILFKYIIVFDHLNVGFRLTDWLAEWKH